MPDSLAAEQYSSRYMFHDNDEIEEEYFECHPSLSFIKTNVVFSEKVIYLNTVTKFSEDERLFEIKKVLEDAKSLLNLENNWNGEGYKLISKEVFERLSNFVLLYASHLIEKDYILESPEIFPSKDGSLYLEWSNSLYTFTIKINSEKNIAYYYFERTLDNGNKIDANGEIQTNQYFLEIAIWFQKVSKKES